MVHCLVRNNALFKSFVLCLQLSCSIRARNVRCACEENILTRRKSTAFF